MIDNPRGDKAEAIRTALKGGLDGYDMVLVGKRSRTESPEKRIGHSGRTGWALVAAAPGRRGPDGHETVVLGGLGQRGTGGTGDGASRFASSAIRWSRIW